MQVTVGGLCVAPVGHLGTRVPDFPAFMPDFTNSVPDFRVPTTDFAPTDAAARLRSPSFVNACTCAQVRPHS
jgi:hypothetical protein